MANTFHHLISIIKSTDERLPIPPPYLISAVIVVSPSLMGYAKIKHGQGFAPYINL